MLLAEYSDVEIKMKLKILQNGTTTISNGGGPMMLTNGHHVHNGSLPPLKNGLGSLADDLYLNRLHSKIGHEMDVDLPKFHDDYMISNGNAYYDSDKVIYLSF
jgi:hypothetical protein